MAARESITFDFVSRGASGLASDFRKTGDNAVLASRGAKVLADVLGKLGEKENRTAEESVVLAKALRLTGDAEDRVAAKAVLADVAIRRLDNAMKNTSGIDKWTSKLSSLQFIQPSFGGSLLSLLPTLIPVAANLGGAVAAVGVSFGAATVAAAGFGAVAGSVLSQASQDLTKLQTLNSQLASATTKSAKDKIRQQIQALEAGWTPAFKKLMGDLQDLKTAWKGTSIQIAAPALLPWLDAVKKGIGFLKPLLEPVAAIFKSWGQTLDQYFSSGKGSAEVTRLASAFGQFAALQLNDVVLFLKSVGTAVFNLGKDLGVSGANFYTFGTDLVQWGAAFAKWSASKNARDDVAGFIRYIHNTGPKLVGIVKDLAKFIPGIFAGATTAGTLELQALGTFLGWVSKLPPSWAKPVTELAGAMLLLSKTGVLKVGIQLIGGAAKLISGGTLSLGGASAASEIEAAFRTGGAVAAAEIRGAITGAGAAAGGEEAAAAAGGGGLLSRIFGGKPSVLGFSFGTILAGGVIAAVNTKLPGMHETIWSIGDPPPKGKQQTWLNSWSGLGHAIAAIFDRTRHDIAHIWDLVFNNTIGRIERGRHDIASEFDTWRRNTAVIFNGARHDIAHVWDLIWNNTIGRIQRGVHDANDWFHRLPGMIVATLRGFGTTLWNLGHTWLTDLWNGIKSVGGGILGWFGGFIGKITGFLGKLTGHSPSGEFYFAGQKMMTQLAAGLKSRARVAASAAEGALGAVGSAGAGVQQWRPLVLRALGMEGLSPLLAGRVLYQMQTESGGRVNAINNWDANAAAGTPSKGLLQVIQPTFDAYHWPGTSWNIYNPLANIAAAINYARHRYGPTLMSGGMGMGSGHGYALGTLSARPGWAWVGERGPELVRFRGGEQVAPVSSPSRGGGEQRIVLEIRGGGSDAIVTGALLELLRKAARTHAGGNVQVLLGRN